MTSLGHLWAVGFDDIRGAAAVRDEIAELAQHGHDLVLLEVAVAVRYRDGSFTLNGEPFCTAEPHVGTLAQLLAALAFCAPPMTGPAVGYMLSSVGVTPAEVGIGDAFVRDVERLIRPGTSALFVLDEVGDMDAVLHTVRGLGGTVLKTNVDLERARLIQTTLAYPAKLARPDGGESRASQPSA